MRSAYVAQAVALGDAVGDRAGCLGERLFHLWHGELSDRAYDLRHAILAAHDFDPARDLEVSPAGAWAWRDPTRIALREAIAGYFNQRRENGAAPASDATTSPASTPAKLGGRACEQW